MRRKEARDGGRKADPNPRGRTGQGSGAARAAAGDAAGATGTKATPGGGASEMSVAIPDYVEPFEGWRAARAYPAEIIVPAPPRASSPTIMAPREPAGATAEEIADALSCYAVPMVVLPHTPAEALEVVARERGRDDRIGS